MKRFFLILLLLTSALALGEVVRLAPNFALEGAGKTATLRSLQGKPVVLIIGKSADEKNVRAQVKKLKDLYQEFASRQVIFVAAFQDARDSVQSDIPFVLAKDGAKVAADYGVGEPFNLIIIGKDGNVDLQTAKVCPASRVRDVVINSYAVQAAGRK